jgi:hypothetical protein
MGNPLSFSFGNLHAESEVRVFRLEAKTGKASDLIEILVPDLPGWENGRPYQLDALLLPLFQFRY